MDQYFDIKLVRKLQEEVTCESEGPIDNGDGFGKLCKECYKPIKDCICKKDIPESKEVNESKSEWFAKEKLAKLKIRLTRVRQLYKKNPKESDKYEREGVALEGEIEELEGKIKDFADKKVKKEAPKEEVKEDVETMPETEPITKPDTAPTPTPRPRTPNWPQPNVSPNPKAKRTPSQEAFIKARESRIVKVK